MSKAFALRSSNSGPQFDGNAGDVLTLQADGKCKFEPGGGGGGGVLPLTLEFVVDQGRAGSTQDGSIANPFLTIQNGIDAIEASLAGAGSLLVAQGDYSSEELTCALDISIVASTTPITVAKLGTDVGRVPGVRLYNVTVTGESWLIGGSQATAVEGGGLLGPVDITGEPHLAGFNATFGSITCLDVLGVLSFRGCTCSDVLGAEGGFQASQVDAWASFFSGRIDGETVNLRVCTGEGSVNAFRATLEQSTVQQANVANTLTADTFSLNGLRIGAASSTPLLTNVSDHPATQAVCTVPPLEGGMDETTISGVSLNLKPGDTVDVSLATSDAVPRLDNIGIAATWVEDNGDLVVRFFGSTPGGTQLLDLNFNQNTP